MFTALAEALAAGLSLWSHKEKTRYADELMSLRKRHLNEISKPIIDDNAVDHLEWSLRNLSAGFALTVTTQVTPTQ